MRENKSSSPVLGGRILWPASTHAFTFAFAPFLANSFPFVYVRDSRPDDGPGLRPPPRLSGDGDAAVL